MALSCLSRKFVFLAAGVFATVWSAAALAQTTAPAYPVKPVRVVVPYLKAQ